MLPHNYALVGRALIHSLDGPTLGTLVVAAGVSVWRGRTRDTAFGAWMTLGLIAAPIVWSQHLVLALVPLVVVFRRIVSGGSSLALAGWALLVLLLSLPDPAVAHLHDLLASFWPALSTVPVVSLGLVGLWAWLLIGTDPPAVRHTVTAMHRVSPVAS